MTVYVETNFLLEIAFSQSQREQCEGIVEWAEMEFLKLALPAYCIAEPYEAWIRRAKKRRRLGETFSRELKELIRSRTYAELHTKSHEVMSSLIESIESEKEHLDHILERIVEIVELIPMTGIVLKESIAYQNRFGLSPQDSIVYASVLSHLPASGDSSHFFLNKNVNDFAEPDIEDELARHDCRVITHFGEAFGVIRDSIEER